MYRTVNAPVLGIIENMSYFVCPHCGERTEIFCARRRARDQRAARGAILGRDSARPARAQGGRRGPSHRTERSRRPSRKALSDIADRIRSSVLIPRMPPDVPRRSARVVGSRATPRSHWSLALIAFLARALFIYRDAMPDPDALMMAAGMALDMNRRPPGAATHSSGRHVSPGYAFLVRAVYRSSSTTRAPSWRAQLEHGDPLRADGVDHVPARAAPTSPRAAGRRSGGDLDRQSGRVESGTYFHTVVPSTLLLLVAMLLAFSGSGARGAALGVLRRHRAVRGGRVHLTRTGDRCSRGGGPAAVDADVRNRARRDTLVDSYPLAAIVAGGSYALVLAAIAREKHALPSGGFIVTYTSWYAGRLLAARVGSKRRGVGGSSRSASRCGRRSPDTAMVRRHGDPLCASGRGRRRRCLRAHGRCRRLLFWISPHRCRSLRATSTRGDGGRWRWLVGVVGAAGGASRRCGRAAAIVALNLALPEAAYAAGRLLTWGRAANACMARLCATAASPYWSGRVARLRSKLGERGRGMPVDACRPPHSASIGRDHVGGPRIPESTSSAHRAARPPDRQGALCSRRASTPGDVRLRRRQPLAKSTSSTSTPEDRGGARRACAR